jgi:hypothetical protein
MMQYDTLQYGTKCLSCANMRNRGTFSYEVSNTDPDLREQIKKLRAIKNSPYTKRSEADIAGMILSEFVPKEIEKYESNKEKS